MINHHCIQCQSIYLTYVHAVEIIPDDVRFAVFHSAFMATDRHRDVTGHEPLAASVEESIRATDALFGQLGIGQSCAEAIPAARSSADDAARSRGL